MARLRGRSYTEEGPCMYVCVCVCVCMSASMLHRGRGRHGKPWHKAVGSAADTFHCYRDVMFWAILTKPLSVKEREEERDKGMTKRRTNKNSGKWSGEGDKRKWGECALKCLTFHITFWHDIPPAAEQNVWLSSLVRRSQHCVKFDDKLNTLSSAVILRQINGTHLNCRSALKLLGEVNSGWPVQFTGNGLYQPYGTSGNFQSISSQFRVLHSVSFVEK
jgi:hypothetical protein